MTLLFPAPPDWLVSSSAAFVDHAAPYAYWLLTVTHFSIWGVLRWQKIGGETYAARWFRRFILAKSFLWLILAMGRTIAPDWRVVGFALVTIYIVFTTLAALIALFLTYVWPVLVTHWRDREDKTWFQKARRKGLL